MSVDEASVLRATLDRRLGIDRLLAIDPLRALVNPADPPRHGDQPVDDPARSARGDSATASWSTDALRLQTLAGRFAAAPHVGGPLRFDMPLLVIDPKANDAAARASVEASTAVGLAAAESAPLGGDAAAQDASTSNIRHAAEPNGLAPVFVPLMLQGPAWIGQPMELIVRRERADELLDNPALDHWCGEVVIDLPELGRVAGHLEFSIQGLRVRLVADHETSVAKLTAATTELAAAFATNDLRVSGLSVGRPAADAMHAAAPWSSGSDFPKGDRGAA